MLMVEKTCYSPEAGGIVSLSYPPKPPKDVDDVRQRVGNDALVSELEQHTKPPPAQPQREPRIRFYRPSELRDYDGSGDSPDRLDAMAYALSSLMVEPARPQPVFA